MPAASKIIDATNFKTPEAFADAKAVALRIRRNNAEITRLNAALTQDKKALSETSKKIFEADLSKETPDIFGNHEFHTDDGTVNTNYKIVGRPLSVINGEPAGTVLKAKFGMDAYTQIFNDVSDIKVTAEQVALRAQITEHPELFTVTLNQLTHEQRLNLIRKLPDLVSVVVVDPKAYAEVYSGSVEKTPAIDFKEGFIELLGKLPEVVKKNARGILKAMLPQVVQIAVGCKK